MSNQKTLIDENNMAHHRRYTPEQASLDARKIYLSTFAGDMATINHTDSPAAGYPMGSVSPFFIDYTGNPVIFTANIAQHTKNTAENPKTSLMVRDVKKNHAVETGWRLTSLGDLHPINASEIDRIAKAYFRHYPNAKSYENTHGFNFYRLHVKLARLILTFGKIAWVDADALVQASPLDEQTEDDIIKHMNDDHVDAMKSYLKATYVELKPSAKPPKLVAVNQFGVTISYRKRLHFIAYDTEAADAMAIRKQLVALAKQ